MSSLAVTVLPELRLFTSCMLQLFFAEFEGCSLEIGAFSTMPNVDAMH